MSKTISVIIPVYNVATYLPECMASLLSQSYRDLEIWLIDDGSTDQSPALCDQYAAKDERVHVIHQKNGGAANAKNAGLRAATGYYLTFLDSDDYLEEDAYAYMVSTLEEHHADVLQCAYRDVYTNRQEDQFVLPEITTFAVEEYLKRYTIDWTCGLLWDKLYKRELFNGIFFEEGHIVDDEFFTYQGIMNAKTVVYAPKIIYNYRKRKSSVTGKPEYRTRTVSDRLDYLEQRRERIGTRYPSLKAAFDEHYLRMLQWLSEDAYVTAPILGRIKRMLKMYFAEKDHTRVSFRTRLRLLKIRLSPCAALLNKRNKQETVTDMDSYFD